jgi:DNA-binding GntR family transcriptional regulator
MLNTDQIKMKTLTHEVVKILEGAILSGDFKPNERLVEREIAQKLGISRVPVREALIQLKNMGLVRDLKRNVKVIAEISRKDIEELYKIKNMIEIHALCETISLEKQMYIEELDAILAEMESQINDTDVEQYRKLNNRFHETIVRSSENDHLFEIYKNTVTPIRWCQKYTLFSPRLRQSFSEHKKIARFCKDKQTQRLREILTSHNMQALERIQSSLPSKQGG